MTPIVWDVDTQKDFIDENGKLSVPGAVNIVEKLHRVALAADANGLDILGSVDAHPEDDEEFKTFPAHCVYDTEGQEKIPETIVCNRANVYYVPNTGHGVRVSLMDGMRQMYFEKQTYNVWDKTLGQPDNIETVLQMMDVTDVYVMGVATDICVLAAVKGFLNRQYNVTVIEDAIAGLDNSAIAIDEMKALGAKFITTEEFENINWKELQ